jgi:hypothetical protein
MLLERAAVQRAKTSMSRRCGLDTSQHAPSGRNGKDVLIHQPPRNGGGCVIVLIHVHIAPNRDARNTLNARRSRQGMRGRRLPMDTTLIEADATTAPKIEA